MAKPKLKKAVKVLYVKALRSNKFQQGKRKLKCMGRHCALGVLAELYEQSKGRELPDDYLGWYPKPAVWKWAGLLIIHIGLMSGPLELGMRSTDTNILVLLMLYLAARVISYPSICFCYSKQKLSRKS